MARTTPGHRRRLPGLARRASRLAADTSHHNAPALLDALPMLGDQLSDASDRLASQLYAAFDLQLIYSKEMRQVSIHAVITPSTPATLAAIIADSETPDAPVTVTNQAGLSVLEPHPIRPEWSAIMVAAGRPASWWPAACGGETIGRWRP